MKVNDFFCGAGGMGLGFKRAGWEIAGAWDFNKYAVETYSRNVGQHVQLADISKLKGAFLPKANLWTFGFPCQDISVAGEKKGLVVICEGCESEYVIKKPEDVCPTCKGNKFRAKSRSGMFFEIMRLLGEVDEKPEIILAENVKQLKGILPVLKAEYEKAGYIMYVKLFNSKYWGVAQNRERYFVVGVRQDLDTGFSFKFPEEQTEFVPKLSTALESNVDEKFYLSDEKAAKIIEQALLKLESLGNVHPCLTPERVERRQQGRRAREDEEPMFTITAQDKHGIIERVEEPHLKLFGSLEYYGNDQMNRVYDPEGISPTLKTMSGGGRGVNIIERQPGIEVVGSLEGVSNESRSRVYSPEGISPTVDTCSGGGRHVKILEKSAEEIITINPRKEDGTQTYQQDRVYDPDGFIPALTAQLGGRMNVLEKPRFRVRRLTPREYARLQGFPDDFTFTCSDSRIYEQMGNAVSVPVAEAMANSIKESLSLLLGLSLDKASSPIAEDSTLRRNA